MQTLRGIAVSPGIAIGPSLVVDPRGQRLPHRVDRGRRGRRPSSTRLDPGPGIGLSIEAEQAEAEARQRLGPQYADILAAHARMIADPTLRGDDRGSGSSASGSRAEHAVSEVLDGHADRLERLADSHLAARAADVRDIQQRILGQLAGRAARDGPGGPGGADRRCWPTTSRPARPRGLDPGRVLGFATEAGGRASHTAIVAEALEIPAVVGLGRFLDLARDAADGRSSTATRGWSSSTPTPPTLERYRRGRRRARRPVPRARRAWPSLPAETLDGVPIGLWGNIEFPDEVAACLELGRRRASACTGPSSST